MNNSTHAELYAQYYAQTEATLKSKDSNGNRRYDKAEMVLDFMPAQVREIIQNGGNARLRNCDHPSNKGIEEDLKNIRSSVADVMAQTDQQISQAAQSLAKSSQETLSIYDDPSGHLGEEDLRFLKDSSDPAKAEVILRAERDAYKKYFTNGIDDAPNQGEICKIIEQLNLPKVETRAGPSGAALS